MGSNGTWEAAVQQVTLAGRTEELGSIAGAWKILLGDFDYLASEADGLRQSVAGNWRGTDAKSFYDKATDIINRLGKIQQNYGPAMSGVQAASQALAQAMRSIPIPVFDGKFINGTESYDGKSFSGSMLYADYQTEGKSNGYRDFFEAAVHYLKSKAPGETSDTTFKSWTGSAGSHDAAGYDSKAWANAKPEDRDKAIKAAAQSWYNANAPVAAGGFSGLRDEYVVMTGKVPGYTSGRGSIHHGSQGTGGDHGPHGTGGDGAGTGAGSGHGDAGNGDVGAGTGVGSLPSGTAPSDWSSGALGAGSANPGGVGGATGSDPTSGLSGVGSMSGTSGGGNLGSLGAGGSGGIGAGAGGVDPGGLGGGDVGGAVPAFGGSVGPGSGRGAEPIGAGSDPKDFLPERPVASGGQGGAGMAAPGAGGAGRGNQQRDRSMDWLREDQDVWYDDSWVPPAVIRNSDDLR